jgi:hypothetical protein
MHSVCRRVSIRTASWLMHAGGASDVERPAGDGNIAGGGQRASGVERRGAARAAGASKIVERGSGEGGCRPVRMYYVQISNGNLSSTLHSFCERKRHAPDARAEPAARPRGIPIGPAGHSRRARLGRIAMRSRFGHAGRPVRFPWAHCNVCVPGACRGTLQCAYGNFPGALLYAYWVCSNKNKGHAECLQVA